MLSKKKPGSKGKPVEPHHSNLEIPSKKMDDKSETVDRTSERVDEESLLSQKISQT